MNTFFANDRFYPQNFILRNCPDTDMMELAQLLAEDAMRIAPASFNGTQSVFSFQLRYSPPYETFTELKRLQTEAIYHTHFKDEYRGFIRLDLSEWTEHADEDYFTAITLPFLADMSSEWYYIFCFAHLECGARILSALSEVFWCKDISDKARQTAERISVVDALYREGITFSDRANTISQKVFGAVSMRSELVPRIVRDFAAYFGKPCVVSAAELTEYLKGDTYMHALLKETSFDSPKPYEKESA